MKIEIKKNRRWALGVIQKAMTTLLLIMAFVGCSKDGNETSNNEFPENGFNENEVVEKGNFVYMITGDVSSEITGDDADIIKGDESDKRTLIRFSEDQSANFFITIALEELVTGTFPVNNETGFDENGDPIILPVEEGEVTAQMVTGGALTGTSRDFHTRSGDGGTVTLTHVDANSIEGAFKISLLTRPGAGETDPLLSVTVEGEFLAFNL